MIDRVLGVCFGVVMMIVIGTATICAVVAVFVKALMNLLLVKAGVLSEEDC